MKRFVWECCYCCFWGSPLDLCSPSVTLEMREARAQMGGSGGPSAQSTTHCSARWVQLGLQLWDPRRGLLWLGPAVSFVKPKGYMTASSSQST